MSTAREPGRTFAPDDLGFIDFETRSPVDIKTAGLARYMTGADAIVLAYGFGWWPAKTVAVPDFTRPLRWADMPDNFRRHHDRVLAGTAIWVAWNAPFDRYAWNYGTEDFPELEVHHIIDAMTQATNSGMPPDLRMASRYAGRAIKDDIGKDLIKLFCIPGAVGTPQSHPEEWRLFSRVYAPSDIEAMQSVFQVTRQLPLGEWEEHWAMERINDRGVAIDMPMVEHAAQLAQEDKRRSRTELAFLTSNAVSSVDQVAGITRWLLTKLPAEGRDILLKREQEIDEEGVTKRPAKFAMTRRQVERLIAYVQDIIDNDKPWPDAYTAPTVLRVLQIRLYGGSKAPAKFTKMLAQEVKGVLYGQYVPSGASQTGRASSKGVQVHNLTRSYLKYEHDAIEAILGHCTYDRLAALGDNSPVSRKLALLIRPSFVPASDTNVFVWSDWSNIEARITPWLADYHPGAVERLEIFRAVDADPTVPDIYTRTAADVSGVPIKEVTKPIRQRGKVVELALTFLGGVGALHAMAAGYGMVFTEDEARRVVKNWRDYNVWALDFGNTLWDAMLQAREEPNTVVPAGRVQYIFKPDFLGGSMLCRLPSGRLLTYRAQRFEDVDEMDDDGNVIGKKRELTYGRGRARAKLWKGILVENCTQAVAADILRGTLVRLEADGFNTRLHTHDEVVGEVNEQNAGAYAEALRWQMRRGFDWTDGLPLMSEETISPYYSKWEPSK